MPYDQPQTMTFSVGLHDFGAGSEALSFKGPSGKQGRVVDVICSATETFTATTTEAIIELGSTAGGAEYVNFGLGTLADTDTARASDTDGDIVSEGLPADTQVEVTLNAPTGGTPAGIAMVQVITEWW